MGNTKKSGVNNSKFRSLSPYRTFFKENKKEGQSLIGKKVLPGYGKKANKIYVSNRANCWLNTSRNHENIDNEVILNEEGASSNVSIAEIL